MPITMRPRAMQASAFQVDRLHNPFLFCTPAKPSYSLVLMMPLIFFLS